MYVGGINMSKTNVLLINPPLREDSPPASFPLGLAYVARVLDDAGFGVRVLDIDGLRLDKQKVLSRLKKALPHCDAVGIGAIITSYSYIKWITRKIKEINPDVKIIIGGGITASVPDLLLNKTDSDILVIWEAEMTMVDLMKNIDKDLSKVEGIVFKKDGNIIRTPNRELIKNMDDIKFPLWEKFPVKKYLKDLASYYHKYESAMTISTVRGCPYRCTYCFRTFHGLPTRFRSARSIVDEMKELKRRYDVQLILFADDLFIAHRPRVFEFCKLLKKEKLGMKWMISARVNLLDRKLLRTMRSAGCVRMMFGVESGSDRILKEMNKCITAEQARNAIIMSKEEGFVVCPTFMVGMPGETKETFRETIDFCKSLGLAAKFFYTCPYPGTDLWKKVKHKIPDEEKFIMQLGDAKDFTINLTEMSDAELIQMKEDGERDLELYCLKPRMLLMRVRHYLKSHGLKDTIKESFRTIKRLV
jgi:radical SAM superfamily enzyme YgiQ (UPF0313 family)